MLLQASLVTQPARQLSQQQAKPRREQQRQEPLQAPWRLMRLLLLIRAWKQQQERRRTSAAGHAGLSPLLLLLLVTRLSRQQTQQDSSCRAVSAQQDRLTRIWREKQGWLWEQRSLLLTARLLASAKPHQLQQTLLALRQQLWQQRHMVYWQHRMRLCLQGLSSARMLQQLPRRA